ncbi:MAG: nucleoside triphosphate pyrophosphohydrolase [Enterobacteriaceae bacterium]
MTDSPIERLLQIMRMLRDPQTGCAWDRQQTFDSIAACTLEETYEVLDAIQRQDFSDLRSELGDLLFQVVFYAQLAQEEGRFNFADICEEISDKLIRRHPHVFEGASAADSAAALQQWEQRKAQERQAREQHSILDDIPSVLPSLMRAQKIQRRCATVGFDWTSFAPVLDKLYEEIEEVKQEAQQTQRHQARVEEELGDMLFAAVNVVRHLGGDAETVLQAANRKFERRFRQVEQRLASEGRTLQQTSLQEMDAIWDQVKQQE